MKCLITPELTHSDTELVQTIYKLATKVMSQHGSLPQTAFFRAGPRARLPGLKPGHVAAVKLDMPGSDDGKDAVARFLKEFARRADADLSILTFESWMIRPNEKEAQYIKDHGEFLVRPSEHPDRMEIVLISVSKPGYQNWSAWVEITRDSTGRPSIPSEMPPLEYLQSEGRFSNILDVADTAPSLS